VPSTIDAVLLTGWASAATSALEEHCAEIDRINVFPVPDWDTGTNLLLTMRSATDAVHRGLRGDESDPDAGAVSAALARGALLGARGNSGVILSQVLRGLAEAVARAAGRCGGAVLADALARADRLATAAVARPRHGTVLTVLSAAARAAAGVGSDRLADVAVAGADAAGEALRATTCQLPELARAGVVDAGGLGLYLVLDALAALTCGGVRTGVPAPTPLRVARDRDAPTAGRTSGSAEFDHEVMYLLDGSDDLRAATLRAALDALGDSVAVVGDGTPGGAGTWNVHVHCADVGAAVEAGVEAGRPHRITVARLADGAADGRPDPPRRFVRDRAVVLLAPVPEIAALARAAGADVLERVAGRSVGHGELVAALAGTRARHVVLLPDAPELAGVAERAARAARDGGQEVVVVPTASVLQGLSAVAVHDPRRHPGDDVAAMADAAAGTRTGALLVAETEALTWVGPCQPGEVLGLTDGEVVLIAPDLGVGALWLAHRMLTAGGELVTALVDDRVGPGLGEGLAADLRRTHPEVDVVVYRGGRMDHPLVLGVE
jgi:DAK2 domain fusion protein YloV